MTSPHFDALPPQDIGQPMPVSEKMLVEPQEQAIEADTTEPTEELSPEVQRLICEAEAVEAQIAEIDDAILACKEPLTSFADEVIAIKNQIDDINQAAALYMGVARTTDSDKSRIRYLEGRLSLAITKYKKEDSRIEREQVVPLRKERYKLHFERSTLIGEIERQKQAK